MTGTGSSSQDALRIVAVGDLMLGDSAKVVGFGVRTRYDDPEILADALQGFAKRYAAADLVFGNLETTLSEEGLDRTTWRSRQMRGRREYAVVLRRAGFSVLNVANNHAMQHGRTAFEDTRRALAAAGVLVCGLRGLSPWCAEPCVVSVRERRIGILGYCLRPRQFDQDIPPYAEGTPDQICTDVARLRETVDHVFVSLHWGEEFVDRPSASEVALAHRITAAGACLIFGHHPHVLRPIEVRTGVATAFSLGNFLSDMTWDDALRRGGVLECRLDGRGPFAVKLDSVYTTADYRPRLDDRECEDLIRRHVTGVEDSQYDLLVRRTVRRVRFAAYRYALRSVRRYEARTLGQLVMNTVRNRVAEFTR